MGNEQSAPYEGPPEVLKGRDVRSIVKYMNSNKCRKVFVMLGAGVSTAAGIPDFRTPGTGLYSNIERLKLPYPEAVFEINYFATNPLPFYTLARELYPGRFRPTLTHTFVKLLADHSLLDTCFTQNIDTLERQARVPAHRIVEAHGSFADQHCIECKQAFDGAKMKKAIETSEISRCEQCGGLVKPDIVFFGEPLPPLFQQSVPKLREADLLFVIGTSLKVHPFASLTGLVPAGCPRVLINMERAGDIGARPDDVVLLGQCDDVVREIAQELGWADELVREWGKTEILVPLEALHEDKEQGVEEEEEKGTGTEGKDDTGTPSADVNAPRDASAAQAADKVPGKETEREDADVDVLVEKVAQSLAISEDKELGISATTAPATLESTASDPGLEEGRRASDSKPVEDISTEAQESTKVPQEKEKL